VDSPSSNLARTGDFFCAGGDGDGFSSAINGMSSGSSESRSSGRSIGGAAARTGSDKQIRRF
jgi:hypothetical protein